MKLLLVLLSLVACPALASERVASFGFELVNTSLEPTRPDETARIQALGRQMDDALLSRDFVLVDMAPVAGARDKLASLHECPLCELDMARSVGADISVQGWVQKVSNLILNINVTIRQVTTGKLLRADSVDIRGNTDESWQRGLRWLLRHRLFPEPPPNGG